MTPNFFAELTTFLEALATYRCPVVLLGDFNVHLEKIGNADADELKNLLASFDMCQHVQDTTHTARGCLDLVITQSEVKVTDTMVSNIGFSDHCLVTCQLLVNLSEVDPIPVESRKWKGFSVESFKSDLSKSALCGDLNWTLSASVNELFDRYSYEMSTLLNLHAPRSRKRRKKHLLTQLSNVLLVDWRRNIVNPARR